MELITEAIKLPIRIVAWTIFGVVAGAVVLLYWLCLLLGDLLDWAFEGHVFRLSGKRTKPGKSLANCFVDAAKDNLDKDRNGSLTLFYKRRTRNDKTK